MFLFFPITAAILILNNEIRISDPQNSELFASFKSNLKYMKSHIQSRKASVQNSNRTVLELDLSERIKMLDFVRKNISAPPLSEAELENLNFAEILDLTFCKMAVLEENQKYLKMQESKISNFKNYLIGLLNEELDFIDNVEAFMASFYDYVPNCMKIANTNPRLKKILETFATLKIFTYKIQRETSQNLKLKFNLIVLTSALSELLNETMKETKNSIISGRNKLRDSFLKSNDPAENEKMLEEYKKNMKKEFGIQVDFLAQLEKSQNILKRIHGETKEFDHSTHMANISAIIEIFNFFEKNIFDFLIFYERVLRESSPQVSAEISSTCNLRYNDLSELFSKFPDVFFRNFNEKLTESNIFSGLKIPENIDDLVEEFVLGDLAIFS